ncbi:MAG: septation protein IspZ [Bdellovibrionaceae bacterium]|nr:septation protein IspZ [Bdellovibrio sp.]
MSLLNQAKELPLTSKPTPKGQFLALFFGGLLPVIAFTVIEEKYGIVAGLIAGMAFGFGEIVYELIRYRKVSTMTWVGNGMLLVLGAVSLISNEGIWFKLQPALFEFGFFIFLLGSWFLKKPFLVLMIEKQNPDAPDFLKRNLSGMTLRLSFFFFAHAALATWAAYAWSTGAWALLKGVGLTVSMIVYMVLEVLYARKRIPRN